MKNRQLRVWIFILYPDNESHRKAVDILDKVDNSLIIKHNELKVDQLGIEHKEHYHCICWYDKPYWLSSLIQFLQLDEDIDSHLFHSFKDFKGYKSIDEYIIYLTHQFRDDKPDKYSIDDFFGGRVEYARDILSNIDKPEYDRFLDLVEFVREYNLEHFEDTRTYTFSSWYKICCQNGYGSLFFKHWYKMRDILKAYINY